MSRMIEFVKMENAVILENNSEVCLDPLDSNTVLLTSDEEPKNLKDVLSQNGRIIQIVTDYECVTCHRTFPAEEMLKEHLEVCREEDDSTHILELGSFENYDSDNDIEDPDSELIDDTSNESHQSKNNNGAARIKPVGSNQCHCCAEDLATAHSGGDFKCQSCDLSFKKAHSLERHCIVIHWEEQPSTCDECGTTFRDKKSLEKHRYTTHVTHKVYRCEPCDKYFSRSYHLNRHKMQSGCHGELRNTYSCQVCNKTFTRKDNLREHLRTHAGAPSRQKKPCSHCSKEFYTTQQLVIHERTHTGERPVQCDLCPKTFLSTLAMKKHRRVHTGEKPFECKFCQRKFAARETLNRHQRTHTGDKPHVCQYCGKSFIQAAQLRAHVFHHTGENGFYCDKCGKAFNRKARLTVHVKYVHEGVTPFKCEACMKAFTRKEDLVKHTIIHTGIKPYKCSKCDKCFATKSSLHAHSNTHKREPPQSCAECGRAFMRQDCLMRHMRAKHRELLDDVMAEAEKKQLQLQLFNIASTAVEKIKSGESNALSSDELLKAIVELLTIIIEEDTLEMFGWPKAPIQDILEAVIRRCGHQPITSDSDLTFEQRLRENVKLLFTVVIEDETVKSLLTTQTVDEVIMHVLKLSKEN